MIPAFPVFKVIEVSDRQAVEAHTHRFPPYSDFNFTSLWAWDTNGERMISELNGNLVAKFTDYSTHEPFLSFLGINETEHTARTLIDHAKAEGVSSELRLMPEISVRDMRPSVLYTEEDRDNFDYIYSVPALASLRGNTYMSKRGRAKKFKRTHPDVRIEVIDLADTSAQKDIRSVIALWEEKKVGDKKEFEIEHERTAIERLCKSAGSHELVATGVFVREGMIGFSIEEVLPGDYAICHFWKADSSHSGVFDFLMQEKAKHLETLGTSFLNYEQDLGIPALRTAKNSYRPINFFKKFVVGYTLNDRV